MPRFAPGPETGIQFRNALGRFATGVTIVTCQSDHGPLGITANSFASVSLDPPLILWSPAKGSSRHDAFVCADRFVVHVLAADQEHVCHQFTRDGLVFDGLPLEPEALAPIIRGCLAHFECSHFAAHDAGDHTIVVGRVEMAEEREGAPLVFSGGRMGTFSAG